MERYGSSGNEILVEQQRSRKRPKIGDIFVIKLITGLYYWGRIISTAAHGGMGDEHKDYIIYLYATPTEDKTNQPNLDKENLLIPPFFFGSTFWTVGYAETIVRQELEPSDVLPQHYFYDAWHKCYWDGFDNKIDAPAADISPKHIGSYGIPSLGVIDHEIKKVLGLPS